jgi:hypothetical protein
MSSDSRARCHHESERGASLILALVFLFAVGIVLAAVGTLAADALLNTNNARSQRTAAQDADTAVTVAMQYTRYNYVSPASPTGCLPSSLAIPSSDPGRSATNPVEVYCTQDFSYLQNPTRVVDFYACGTTINETTCTTVPGAALLHARVDYSDLNANGLDFCSSTTTSSCGLAMTIAFWDLVGADG